MDQYSTPEIQRVPLDSLLLQMIAMGLPDARKFPFIEPPPPDSIENSILSLKEQVCLNLVFVSNVFVSVLYFA
jgi:HrpA-like RNA helicase